MRRQKIKKMSLKTIILIVISIFFLTISIGYSYLKQSLNIYGKSTIIANQPGDYEKGNSTYTWKIVDSWGQEGTSYVVYQVKIDIVNMDNDISLWNISFDVPSSYNDANSNSWCASSRVYDNGRVTMVGQDWNGYIAKGSTLTLEFQLALDLEEDLYINNLTLNGLLATNE